MMELSYVDQSLRLLLRTLSLDVEHYEKVDILDRIGSDPNEGGYSIVSDYRDSLNERRRAYLENDISSRAGDVRVFPLRELQPPTRCEGSVAHDDVGMQDVVGVVIMVYRNRLIVGEISANQRDASSHNRSRLTLS